MGRVKRCDRCGYLPGDGCQCCAYCGKRAVQKDHLITKNQARRRIRAAALRDDPCYIVQACRNCNEGKGARLRVPPSHEHLIADLETLTGGKYAVWGGDAESLRSAVK